MESAAERTDGRLNRSTNGGQPPLRSEAAMELCPRCGTEYCVGCNNADRPAEGCPNCGKALRPVDDVG